MEIREVIVDGLYDQKQVLKEVERIGAKGVIKVRKNGREKGLVKVRDETIRRVREVGFDRWAKENRYGRRNMVEATFSRLKGIFGERVRA